MNKYIIYMASGSSRRFGGNKLLAAMQGKPLYRWGLDLLESVIKERTDCHLLVVSRYAAIRRDALSRHIPAIDCPDSALGLSHTIRAGIRGIHGLTPQDYLLFVVADQPFLSRSSIHALLDAADGSTVTARLCWQDRPGNPVLFSASLVPELMALEGDDGGGTVVRKHPCLHLSVQNPIELSDIDRADDMPPALPRTE